MAPVHGRSLRGTFRRAAAVFHRCAPFVESEPEKFSLPCQSDLLYHWVHVWLAAIDADEMRDRVEDGWAVTVPKRVAEEYASQCSFSS